MKRIINRLEELKKKMETLPYQQGEPSILDFPGLPDAELGWCDPDDRTQGIYLVMPKSLRNDIWDKRFTIFDLMEDLIITDLAERTNNDACSFQYKIEYRNELNQPEFELKIIDYLS